MEKKNSRFRNTIVINHHTAPFHIKKSTNCQYTFKHVKPDSFSQEVNEKKSEVGIFLKADLK